MNKQDKISKEEHLFLQSYQAKKCHTFKEIQTFSRLSQKLTNE
ncbi:hypothetical protein AALH12_05700 [Streptococcus ferus]